MVGPIVLALVAAAGAGAPSSYAPHSVSGAHPAASQAITGAAPAATPTATDDCGDEPSDAAGWSRLFGAQDGDWAGGDGASSTRLPDGRLLWVFGDTFTGTVDDNGVRGPDAAMLRNSVVITDGACWTSVSPGKDALPGRDGTWLWPTHSVVVRDDDPASVVVFGQRLAADRGDPFGFRRVGAVTATLTIPSHGAPEVGPVVDLPGSDVLWGAALAQVGDHVWIYGTRPHAGELGRDLLLARAPVATVSDAATWTYRTATGWSPSPSDARAVLHAGVSTVLAARATAAGVLLVTKPEEFLDEDVAALTSAHAWGPWTSRVLLQSPSTDTEYTYAPGLVATRPGAAVVVVLSRTSPSARVLMRDALASVPGFVDVGRLAP